MAARSYSAASPKYLRMAVLTAEIDHLATAITNLARTLATRSPR